MLSKRRTPPIRASFRTERPGAGGQKSGRGGGRARIQGPSQKRPFAAFGQAAKGPRTSSLVRGKPKKPVSAPAHRAAGAWTAPRHCGGACRATPRFAAAGCAKACRPRRWQFAAWSSRRMVHRHAARPCLWSFHATPQARCRLRWQGRSHPCPWWLAWPVSGRKPVKPSRGDAESAMSPFGGRSACTSLSCCESWRGRGCALGLMVATFQRKQFPLRCAHSSRDKFFSLPGSPLRFDRKRCGQPIPRRTDHNKDALARPCSTRKEKHHG